MPGPDASSKPKTEEHPDAEDGARPGGGSFVPRHRRIGWGLIALGGVLLTVAVWLIIRSFR